MMLDIYELYTFSTVFSTLPSVYSFFLSLSFFLICGSIYVMVVCLPLFVGEWSLYLTCPICVRRPGILSFSAISDPFHYYWLLSPFVLSIYLRERFLFGDYMLFKENNFIFSSSYIPLTLSSCFYRSVRWICFCHWSLSLLFLLGSKLSVSISLYVHSLCNYFLKKGRLPIFHSSRDLREYAISISLSLALFVSFLYQYFTFFFSCTDHFHFPTVDGIKTRFIQLLCFHHLGQKGEKKKEKNGDWSVRYHPTTEYSGFRSKVFKKI